MSTTPQGPRPAAPPSPPSSGSHIVAIALLGLAFIVFVCVFGIWIGFRVLTHTVHMQVKDDGGEKKEVSISTPFGGLQVNKNANISSASLGLPIYPGAQSIADHDASVSMNFGNEAGFRLVVAKYSTSDNFEKVRNFYQQRLTEEEGKFTPREGHMDIDPGHRSNEEGNFIGKDSQGKTVFEIKRKDYEKVVALKDESDGTRIDLVRVGHGNQDTN